VRRGEDRSGEERKKREINQGWDFRKIKTKEARGQITKGFKSHTEGFDILKSEGISAIFKRESVI
jgi:hypothetical protein